MILQSDGVILTGVGPFGDGMRRLRSERLDDTLWEVSFLGIPLLGIGLGMQLLMTESEEQGLHRGLNLIPGIVRRLPERVKVPHVGWNDLVFVQPHLLCRGVSEGYVYFTHAYGVEVANEEDVLAVTDYGGSVAAVIARHRVFGMQFHPEQSGPLGTVLLKNFVQLCEKERVS